MNRRSFLSGLGLVSAGAAAGLVGRPTVDNLTENPEKIIGGIYTFDGGFVHVALTGAAASAVLIEDSDGNYIYRWLYISLGDPSVRTDRRIEPGQYRAIAVRRNYDDETDAGDIIQEVPFSV